jgi:dihydroneopterin aldolase
VDIGAFQSERGTTQRVRFNVEVEVSDTAGAATDDVDGILSYDTIVDAIGQALSDERLNLLETLAERIAALILPQPRAASVLVRIEKLDRGPFALGVEIVRDRQFLPRAMAQAGEGAAPRVVLLGRAAVAHPRLSAWLDALEAGPPCILCVTAPAEGPPLAAISPARRRIALLALEQQAWVLAGRDPRCVVVETRTEIDWALGRGQMVVWAPSKIVLDAVDGPEGAQSDGAALAAWFAGQLGARELVALGTQAPQASVPVRALALDRPEAL